MAHLAVIIDSQKDRAEVFQRHLSGSLGIETTYAQSCDEVTRLVLSGKLLQPDLVIYTAEPNARKAVESLCSVCVEAQVIALVNHTTVEKGMDAVVGGADNFLVMPFHPSQLTVAVRNALARRNLTLEFRRALSGFRITLDDLLLETPAMQATLFLAHGVAASDSPVVLEGAPGAGRELLARAIHGSSSRADKPFLTFNAALATHKTLAQALFGGKNERGIMEEVGEGSLLIRNIDVVSEAIRDQLVEISSGRQSLYKEGSTHHYFKGRLMFAVNDAPRRNSTGERHEIRDLYSRLNALPINLPYLKDISADIPYLAMLYCRRFSALEGKTILTIAPDAMRMLKELSWPGNLEQLCHSIFNAVMCCRGSELQMEDFRHLVTPKRASVTPFPESAENGAATGADGVLSCMDASGNVRRLQDIEDEMIRYALERYSGHMSEVARYLGIGRSTLYRKLSSMEEK
ncbi:MAG: sigma-54-dependent Fis family transcriptional regulator [Alphaproteobacteria bacterium]|nr:sigma-54-dependent Fis family transcriptional regulator [Alphaproteobacteria bacterium]